MNLHTKVTLAKESDKDDICRLIKDKYAVCKDWNIRRLEPWVSWFIKSNLCVIGYSTKDCKITSLIMGRPVASDFIQLGYIPAYYYYLEGDCFFVDLIINPCSMVPAMTEIYAKRLGWKDYLAFQREGDRVHIYHTKKILRYYEPRAK